MSRNRYNSRNDQRLNPWFRLIRTTFILALVFSAGLIVGKRIGSGDSFVPLMAVAASPTPAKPMEVIDTGEEHLGTDYSFYELLNKREDGAEGGKKKRLAAKKPVESVVSGDPKEGKDVLGKVVEKGATASVVSPKPTAEAAEKKVAEPKYTLQIGSHSNKADAEDEIQTLTKLGVKPYMIEVDVPNRGTFYRVRIGRYASLTDARSAQFDLQKEQKIASFVSPI